MATFRYGDISIPISISPDTIAKLRSESPFGEIDPDIEATIWVRHLIQAILDSGRPRFLPLPTGGSHSRIDLLIAPGIPMAIVSDDDADQTSEDLHQLMADLRDDAGE